MDRRAIAAEGVGTAWLVFGGCGAAVLAAAFPEVGIGLLGVSLAFGLSVVTMAYAFGPVSGGHFNPAVTLGLVAAGRFPGRQAPVYVVAQVIGAVIGAALLTRSRPDTPAFRPSTASPRTGTAITRRAGTRSGPRSRPRSR